MNKEERQLLLTDVCARLVHEVILVAPNLTTIQPTDCNTGLELLIDEGWRPYLRPMSNMTKDEIGHCNYLLFHMEDSLSYYDYLNSIHIDYRGLIPIGLALEAPEGMYNF